LALAQQTNTAKPDNLLDERMYEKGSNYFLKRW